MQSICKFSDTLNKYNTEVTGRRGRRRKKLLDSFRKIMGTGSYRAIARSHSVVNSVWKRLRTCRKTDYGINKYYVRMNLILINTCG